MSKLVFASLFKMAKNAQSQYKDEGHRAAPENLFSGCQIEKEGLIPAEMYKSKEALL